MIKAVFFDMDGTLINSDELVKKCYLGVNEQIAADIPWNEEDWLAITAPSAYAVFARHWPSQNPDLLWNIYLQTWKDNVDLVNLFPGVQEMLIALKVEGYQLGLITSEYKALAEKELTELGILRYFDGIVCIDDVSFGKPDKEPVITLLNKLHLKAYEVIFIGDQRTDFEAARAASVRSGAVSWSPLGRQVIESYRPRLIVEHFDHLLSQLEAIEDTHNETPHKFILTIHHENEPKILHLTDLHLMNNEKDAMTYEWITTAVTNHTPDLIVITGDLTMSESSPALYHQLGQLMESLHTPWTFVFGNHDIDGGIKRSQLLAQLKDCHYLLFDTGVPTYGRMGNFMIRIQSSRGTIYQDLLFLDSGSDTMYPVQGQLEWGYEVVSYEQIEWVHAVLSHYPLVKKTVFVHIPLMEYDLFKSLPPEQINGVFNEGPSDAPFNTGLFEVLKSTTDTQAVWCGHDHYNDCTATLDGILLGFGRVSGHYDYGDPTYPKGAHLLTFDTHQNMTFELLLEKDYGLPR